MIEAIAGTYRERANRARAEAVAAPFPESKRQWTELAADYERLAAFVEKDAAERTTPAG
jgi:hypothetical protein